MDQRPGAGPPLLITMRETEQLLRLDDNSIYKLLAAGEIDAIKVGRSLRIIYQSVEQFVERHRNEQSGRSLPIPDPDIPSPSPPRSG